MPNRIPPRLLIALSVAALLVGAGWLVLLVVAPQPPVQAFVSAQHALGQARDAEAARYAPRAYRAAEREWDAAIAAWQLENGRFFALRAYDALESQALQAARTAEQARLRAVATRDSLRWMATAGADVVRDRFLVVHTTARQMPFDSLRYADIAAARTLLGDADAAVRRGDFLAAAGKVERAAQRLHAAYAEVSATLDLYLADLAAWQAWQQEAIAWSTEHDAPALVVDKMARRLFVYVGGEVRHTFPVELGPNWMGPKRHEGDEATPEGRYRVRRKRAVGAADTTLALELDYPNAEDRRRFEAERAAGTLAPDARIGGTVEVHGAGGLGTDWTDGAVALADADVEVVFDLVGVGTPVVIVGALEEPAFLRPAPPPDPLAPRSTLPISASPGAFPRHDRSVR
ncbi:MAG: L,D-transpeptidase [Rhodothermales bacterium]